MLSGTPYSLEEQTATGAVEALTELDERVGLLRRQGSLDQNTLASLRSEWRVEQIHETLGIEGNSLDINETRLVLARGIAVPGLSMKESEEVWNMGAALDYLEALAGSDTPLREVHLREIHSLILGGETAGAGEYRQRDVEITGAAHTPPSHVEIPALVGDLFSWLETTGATPFLKAVVVHTWITHIHPFLDGNGRTARALMNLILIRYGYPIVLIRTKDRPRYYEALALSDVAGDLAPVLELIVKRAGDSLRQILRLREAATGLSLALEQAEDRARAAYAVWQQAMLLVVAELRRHIDDTNAATRQVRLQLTEYNQVTSSDYQAILAADSSGNGWLAAIRGRTSVREGRLLLWIGYRSQQIAALAQIPSRGADIFLSEPDPLNERPWRKVGISSPLTIQEIAFDGDRYIAAMSWAGQQRVRYLGAAELARLLLTEFIRGYVIDTPEIGRDRGLVEGEAARIFNDEGAALRVTLIGVEDPHSYTGQWPPEEENRYVAVWLQIENVGDAPVHAYAIGAVVGDANRNEYDPYVTLSGPWLPDELSPGESAQGPLIYELPLAVRVVVLRIALGQYNRAAEWSLERRMTAIAP